MFAFFIDSFFKTKDPCGDEPVVYDRSELDIAELQKMVLLKKLEVLDLQQSLYRKADKLLDDLLGNQM